jgi:hypothetical protein
LQVGGHLTRRHLDISRARHSDGHAGIADRFEVGSLPPLIQRALRADAAGIVEFREVEALSKDEDVGNNVTAAAGIGLVVAPGARVRVGAGYAIVQLAVKRLRPYSISWGIGVWNSSPFCMWRGMATSRPR